MTPSGQIQLNGAANSIIDYINMKIAFDLLRTEVNALITVYNSHSSHPPSNGVAATADMSGSEVPTVKVP